MNNYKNLSDDEKAAFYSKEKKRMTISIVVALFFAGIWAIDVKIYPGMYPSYVHDILCTIIVICIISSKIVKCPSCSKHGFKLPKCSVCKFELDEK